MIAHEQGAALRLRDEAGNTVRTFRPGCLSDREIVEFSSKPASASDAVVSHIASCGSCAERATDAKMKLDYLSTVREKRAMVGATCRFFATAAVLAITTATLTAYVVSERLDGMVISPAREMASASGAGSGLSGTGARTSDPGGLSAGDPGVPGSDHGAVALAPASEDLEGAIPGEAIPLAQLSASLVYELGFDGRQRVPVLMPDGSTAGVERVSYGSKTNSPWMVAKEEYGRSSGLVPKLLAFNGLSGTDFRSLPDDGVILVPDADVLRAWGAENPTLVAEAEAALKHDTLR